MRRSLFASSVFGSAVLATLGACTSPDLAGSCPIAPDATPAEALLAKQACYGGLGQLRVNPLHQNDIDILFVIDNSPSMAPKQKVLASAIPKFISVIEGTRANYHVGIVTTDLGINVPDGSKTGKPFATGGGSSCNTAAGDDGVLQNRACTDRTELAGEAAAACAALCPDPAFVPKGGYIAKADGITNVPVQMMGGQDIGPQLAFQCLALVGDKGCGVEQPLEAAKRALDPRRSANLGFNRGTSTLAVIFITDEDDCSVQPDKRNLLDPATPNAATAACNDASQTTDPSCYQLDYRCLARDLSCAEPMNTKGAKTNCMERRDSFLNSIDGYVQFFTSLPNPNVYFAGVWTPTLLDNLASSPAKDGQLFVDAVNGLPGSAALNRGHTTQAACYNPDASLTQDPNGFFGQAQLRLSSFIRRFQPKHIDEISICAAQSYPDALANFARRLPNPAADCFAQAPRQAQGAPECVVGYVDATNQQGTPDVAMPACSAKCCTYFATDSAPNLASDSTLQPNPHLAAEVAACSSDPDCYCAVPSSVNCSGSAVAGLWRAGNAPPPAGKVVSFHCAFPVSGP